MNQKVGWIICGIGSLSSVLGVFIGASNSPVAGVMITGLFGILATLLSLNAAKENDKDKQPSFIDFRKIGLLMIVFSVFIFLGAFVGEKYRVYESPSRKSFVWSNKPIPQSTYEALDWIAVAEILISKGYSKSQIESLYDIRLAELKDSIHNEEQDNLKYSESAPYSRMLEKVPQKEPKRGLASE